MNSISLRGGLNWPLRTKVDLKNCLKLDRPKSGIRGLSTMRGNLICAGLGFVE